MSERLRAVALALVLLAAACSKPPEVDVTFGSGTQFVPQVADFLDDVGLDPSVTVASGGTPYVAYFGFPQEVPEGQAPVPRPIGSPSLPAVLLTSVKDGIWSRGAVAMEAPIPNVSIPFGPAEVPQVASMSPQSVNGTAIAADASGGLHVVWAADTGLWYAANMGGSSFSASEILQLSPPLKVAGPLGAPSIALTSGGTPWVAFTRTSAAGQQVIVATMRASAWKSEVVATVPLRAGGPQPSRTAIGLTGNGTPVVVYSDGSNVLSATPSGDGGRNGGWTSTAVETGADGYGLSLATSGDGTLHASYYAGTAVHAATSNDGTSWRSGNVATVGAGEDQAGRSTGIAVDASGAVYVTWYDPGTNSVQLATTTGSSFTPVALHATEGGDLPSVAVAEDGSAVYVAWHDREDQDLELGTYGTVAGLSLAVKSPTPAGQPSSAPPSTECTKPVDGALDIVAQGIAFDTNCLEATAGQPFTIHFDNKDAGVPHNVEIYTENPLSNPDAKVLFAPAGHATITGPDSTTYEVPAIDTAGEYFFYCVVHPTQMTGTVKVVAGGGGGGGTTAGGGGTPSGGGGETTTTVTAQGIAFDTSTITLAAGEASSLTFVNNDAGVQHDIAIFPSESELTNPLFRGDLITGPDQIDYSIPALDAGTYYFHCDVHPTMNGQVVVK